MAGPDEIVYFDRYKGTRESESVYGEKWLRWTYGSLAGQFLLEAIVKRGVFSRFYGWLMSRPASRARIRPFIVDYGINESEFAEPVESFPHFNAFFARKLLPDARPVAEGEEVAVFPADGRHLVFQEIGAEDGVYAKGQRFLLDEFLGDRDLAERYAGGAISISRLCPVDYHRFHFPAAGKAGPPVRIRGDLYSVNPFALRRRLAILWENRRFLTCLESRRFGRILYVEIGATCVGSVVQSYSPGTDIRKGEEKGYFLFGGSCTVLLFEKDRIRFDDDLVRNSAEGIETYARMGDRLGVAP